MFTGIIEEVGVVKSISSTRLVIAAITVLADLRPGESLAIDGTCLTAVELGNNQVVVELMPETLRRTSLGQLRPGNPVNLERALAPGQRMGGHFVQGHVDATGRIMGCRREGNAEVIRIGAPPEVMGYVIEQGFIAVDGASLTVTECDRDSFSVSLVPYTQQHATLAGKKQGAQVNLEVDIIAKYVEKLVQARKGGITQQFLREQGF